MLKQPVQLACTHLHTRYNCPIQSANAMTDINKCNLSIICQKKWHELAPTGDAEIRFCTHCAKNVFVLRTHAELDVAAAVGRCVALADGNDIVGWIGEPEGTWDWIEEPSTPAKIRCNGPVTAEMVARLQLAFPRVFGAGVNWRAGEWLVLGLFTPGVARSLLNELQSAFPGVEVLVGDA